MPSPPNLFSGDPVEKTPERKKEEQEDSLQTHFRDSEGGTLYHSRKIKRMIYAEIFEEKLSLEIEANHMLVSEIERSIFAEKSKLNSPLYFLGLVLEGSGPNSNVGSDLSGPGNAEEHPLL